MVCKLNLQTLHREILKILFKWNDFQQTVVTLAPQVPHLSLAFSTSVRAFVRRTFSSFHRIISLRLCAICEAFLLLDDRSVAMESFSRNRSLTVARFDPSITSNWAYFVACCASMPHSSSCNFFWLNSASWILFWTSSSSYFLLLYASIFFFISVSNCWFSETVSSCFSDSLLSLFWFLHKSSLSC